MSSPAYEWLDLESDEEIVWSGEPELLGSLWVFALGIVMIPFFGVGLLVIAAAYLDLKNTAYVITTDSVFKKTGVLSRKVVDIGHGNIQDTGYSQSVLGRRYGFGTVEISTAGGSGVEMSLGDIEDPLGVQSTLDRLASRNVPAESRGNQTGAPAVRLDSAVVTELIEEMRATRAALESIEQKLDKKE